MNVYDYTKNKKYLENPLAYGIISPSASVPRQIDTTDVGYLLTITNRTDNRLEDNINSLNGFVLDIVLHAQPNHFIMIVGTDELTKRGYMLPAPTIINPRDSNRNVNIILYKFLDCEDISLPSNNVLKCLILNLNYSHLQSLKNFTTNEKTETFNSHEDIYMKKDNVVKSTKWFR